MSLSFECPSCGQRYALKEGLAGKQATCKKCGKRFRVEAAKPAAKSTNPAPAAGSDGPQAVPLVSAGPDTSLKDVTISTAPKPGPSQTAGVSVIAAGRTKPRKTQMRAGNKRLLVIVSSAGGALLVLIVIGMIVFSREGTPASPVDEQAKHAAVVHEQQKPTAAVEGRKKPAASVPGQQQPTAAVAEKPAAAVESQGKLAKPTVTPTTEVPAGVIAPADVDHRTVGGMKTSEQLFDDLTKQFDGVLPLLSAIRDEATLQDGIPKVSSQISKINDTLSMFRSPAMYGQKVDQETVQQVRDMQRQFGKRLLEETTRIGSIPGSSQLAEEFAKLGRTQPAPRLKRPDEKEMAALPPEEQIKWFMRSRGATEVYAFVFEGLPPEDLPRINKRLGSFRNQGSPTFFEGDRCVKYVPQVSKPEHIVNILNVGDARVNVSKRIAIIRVDRAKLQLLPMPRGK